MDINDPKQIETIKEVLKIGAASDFWSVIVQSLKQSIEFMEEQRDGSEMINLPADQYKVESELLKAKIKNVKKLLEIPDTLTQWLSVPDQRTPNLDPYMTVEEVIEQGVR